MSDSSSPRSPSDESAEPTAPDALARVEEDSGEGSGRRLLLFDLSGRRYACDVETVREVLPLRPTVRLPGTPDFVSGLTNVRGTIVTVFDLRSRLHGVPVDTTTGSMMIVLCGEMAVGVAVDEVRDVQLIPADMLEPAPEDAERPVIALLRLGAELVPVLDVSSLVKAELQT